MASLALSSPIESIPRVGPTISRRLSRLGLRTVRDLLFHFPFRYDDFRNVTTIAKLVPGETATVKGRLTIIENHRSPRKRILLTEALVNDATGSIKAVWFNQPWLTKMLKSGDVVVFSGKVERTAYGVEFVNPAFEKFKAVQTHTARLVPVYSTTEDLTAKQLRFLIASVLPLARGLTDPLPFPIRCQERLLDLSTAVREVHFPTTDAALARARQRLAFDELLSIQLRAAYSRKQLSSLKAPKIGFNEPLVKAFVASLPFKLTNAQRKAAWEILLDLDRERPMNRLLEGDVGSGKTSVAAIAMVNVSSRGFQSAFMAPTEILAEQHAKTIRTMLADAAQTIRVALLTGSHSRLDGEDLKRKELLEKIAEGEVDVVIGTHALIEGKVKFSQLGFVVVDEQHRFGVEQRKTLREKNSSGTFPHLLSMTATPIPRTLALTLYADLDLSVLNELPPGRQPIRTEIVTPNDHERAYAHIRSEVRRGRQGFIICPLIDPSDVLGVKAATKEHERLSKNIFPDLKLGLLHGRMASKKKERVMTDFSEGKLNLLVSTAVVEVGVDVPNATVMVIEGSERFGLAQLHQLRGRIGRGKDPSTCFLFTDTKSGPALERLNAVVESSDGFALAEKDLTMRGSGELFGTLQSGFPELRFARLTDHELIRRTRQLAAELIGNDPFLNRNPILKKWLHRAEIAHPE